MKLLCTAWDKIRHVIFPLASVRKEMEEACDELLARSHPSGSSLSLLRVCDLPIVRPDGNHVEADGASVYVSALGVFVRWNSDPCRYEVGNAAAMKIVTRIAREKIRAITLSRST